MLHISCTISCLCCKHFRFDGPKLAPTPIRKRRILFGGLGSTKNLTQNKRRDRRRRYYDYNGGGEIKKKSRGSSRSGRFQAAGEVFKKVGSEPPHLFKGLPCRPEPQTFWHPGFPFLI